MQKENIKSSYRNREILTKLFDFFYGSNVITIPEKRSIFDYY